MRSTGMPVRRAAFSLPPIANRCRPQAVHLSVKLTITASTSIVTNRLDRNSVWPPNNGTPICPPPIALKTSPPGPS